MDVEVGIGASSSSESESRVMVIGPLGLRCEEDWEGTGVACRWDGVGVRPGRACDIDIDVDRKCVVVTCGT